VAEILDEESYTFDDLILVPRASEVVPSEVDVSTRLTPSILLNVPVMSAAMDTVTEGRMAIALAQLGGLGVIHKNLDIESQALEVEKVKRSENGVITDPKTLTDDATVGDALDLMELHHISGIPVLDAGGKVVGIVTRRDLKYHHRGSIPITEVMTAELVTAPPDIPLGEAKELLYRSKIEKLILTAPDGRLAGVITLKDLERQEQFPRACKDDRGRLRVGAAVGAGDFDRAAELVGVGVDVLIVDSAHGHSKNILETVRRIKKDHDVDVVAGNVATGDGVRDLLAAGADAAKIGIGPGSICTTRVIAGVGVPQITAIMEGDKARGAAALIADGGIKFSGDIAKALAAGADIVMLGGLLAGCDESPGEQIIYHGRSFKSYRGMGSIGAMSAGSADRYFQEGGAGADKLVAEGIEGMVPSKGPLAGVLHQLIGGLKSAMGYLGAADLATLRDKARFRRVTGAGLREAHPHDVQITKEAPNYRPE